MVVLPHTRKPLARLFLVMGRNRLLPHDGIQSGTPESLSVQIRIVVSVEHELGVRRSRFFGLNESELLESWLAAKPITTATAKM